MRNIPQRFTNKDVYDSYHEGDVFRAVVKSTKKDETDWICLTMHGKEARDLLPPHLKGISLVCFTLTIMRDDDCFTNPLIGPD